MPWPTTSYAARYSGRQPVIVEAEVSYTENIPWVLTTPHGVKHMAAGEHYRGPVDLDKLTKIITAGGPIRLVKTEPASGLRTDDSAMNDSPIIMHGPYPLQTPEGMPINGVGRIRREDYIFHFGDEQLDVDEMRTYFLDQKLLPILERWNPLPTREEALWLVWFFEDYPPGTRKEFMAGLYRLIFKK